MDSKPGPRPIVDTDDYYARSFRDWNDVNSTELNSIDLKPRPIVDTGKSYPSLLT